MNHSHRNAQARSRATGRRYVRRVPTAETVAWRGQAYLDARSAIAGAAWRPIGEGGKAVVELTYFWPDRRRRDTHNRIKELMDVLEAAGAFANDCQALARERDFHVDPARPRVEISVRAKS